MMYNTFLCFIEKYKKLRIKTMRLVPMTQNGQITEFEREKEILGET